MGFALDGRATLDTHWASRIWTVSDCLELKTVEYLVQSVCSSQAVAQPSIANHLKIDMALRTQTHTTFEVQRSGKGRFLPSTKLARMVGNTGMNCRSWPRWLAIWYTCVAASAKLVMPPFGSAIRR